MEIIANDESSRAMRRDVVDKILAEMGDYTPQEEQDVENYADEIDAVHMKTTTL